MKPSIRSDIKIVRLAPDQYMLVNGDTDERFNLGTTERFLLDLSNGQYGLETINARFRERFGYELGRGQLEAFYEQLHRHGMLEVGQADRRRDEATKRRTDKGTRNALLLNRILDIMVLTLGWIVHPIWLVPALPLIVFAILLFISRRGLYFEQMYALLQGGFGPAIILLSLTQILLFINLPREFLIAMACRKHGGWIVGFRRYMLAGIFPFFYCDLSDTLFTLKKRGQWTLLLVGIWAQLTIGALAVIGWTMAVPGTLPHTFCLMLILPSIVIISLHAVIFMKLDGYRIISFLLNDPRLQERGLAEARAWLSFRPSPEARTARERFWLRCYGIGCMIWIVLLHGTILIGGGYVVVTRYGGVGALAGALIYIWAMRKKLWRFLMTVPQVRWLTRAGGNWFVRWTVRLVLLAGIIALGFVPYNYEIGGRCQLVPLDEHGVRAQLTDEIIKVHVSEGDIVNQGDLIVTFSGREVRAGHAAAASELKRAEAELDLLRAGPRQEELNIAVSQVELWTVRFEYYRDQLARKRELHQQQAVSIIEVQDAERSLAAAEQLLHAARENLTRLQEGVRPEEIRAKEAEVEKWQGRVAYYEEQMTLLTAHAPIHGRVITPHLQQRTGQVAQLGELITVIQDDASLRVMVAADEAAADKVEPGQPVKVRLRSTYGELLTGRVVSVSRSALSESELTVAAVRSDREGHFEQSVTREDETRYIRVIVELDEYPPTLVAGASGHARIVISEDQLWRAIWRPVARFVRNDVWSWLP